MKRSIDGPTNGIVNLRNWFNFLTFDVIGDMCLGESFHALESGEYHHWVISIFEGLKFWRILRFGNTYPLLGFIMHGLMATIPAIAKERDSFFKLPSVKVEARMKQGNDRKDIMSFVKSLSSVGVLAADFPLQILRHNNEKDESQNMSRSEIVDSACILIVGGSETTATILCGATYLLTKHPEVLRKLRKELDEAFEFEEDINLLALGRLPYLQAVIDESLRFYPPASSIFPRRTVGWEVIDGHSVPPDVRPSAQDMIHDS